MFDGILRWMAGSNPDGRKPNAEGRREEYRTWFDPSAIKAVRMTGYFLVGGLGVVLIAADANRCIGVLTACAIAAASGGLGFLFGIPPRALEEKAAAAGSAAVTAQPSGAGLEQVADWLTKILLGAGLTQLTLLKDYLLKLSEWVSACVNTAGCHANSTELARIFGLGVVGYFGAFGFLGGYLATRLLLARLLRKADKSLTEIEKDKAKQEGKVEGKVEGLAEGKAAGMEIGKKEGLDTATAEITAQKLQEQAASPNDAVAKDQLAKAEKWAPGVAPSVTDDPQKGRFGGLAETNGRRLGATVKPLKDEDGEFFQVDLKVESTDPAKPLTGPVKFYLHDTFDPDNYIVLPEKGVATLEEVISWGAFTVGAIMESGKIMLELDLATIKDAPEKFRSR